MPTTAVIGSNSFTGAHVVDALLEDGRTDVLGISRSKQPSQVFLPYAMRNCSHFQFQRVDVVRDSGNLIQLLDAVRPDTVIFVAAPSEVGLSNQRPLEYFNTNTNAVVILCEYLRRQKWLKRYVHFSSAEIYGQTTKAVTESQPFDPSTPYAVSKSAADLYLTTLVRNFGFPVTVIRSTNVFGAHQQLYKIIPRTIAYSKLGRVIELHAGGTAKKSFVHIHDVVRGLMLALAANASGVFHFSNPSDATVADVVRIVCNELQTDFDTVTKTVGERLGQDGRYWLDCSRAKSELGWQPEISLRVGIRETIAWMEENWQTLKRLPLEYQHRA